MQLQAEIERLQGELDAKTALFEDKFRTQQCLITDNELKLLKSEEANKKFEQQGTGLKILNFDAKNFDIKFGLLRIRVYFQSRE